jgi:hypothetical protein
VVLNEKSRANFWSISQKGHAWKCSSKAQVRLYRPPLDDDWNSKKKVLTQPKLHKHNWDNQWGKWSSTKSANSSHLSCSQSASRSIIHFALHSHQVLHHPDDQRDPEDPPVRHSIPLLQKTL